MNKNFRGLIDLIQDNTNLNKYQSALYLINKEDEIRISRGYKNNNNFRKEYFYLATAKVIDKYKVIK